MSAAAGSSRETTDPNDGQAYRYWLEEAENGNVEARYRVGMCFREGKGVARDPKKAIHWLRKAAKKGMAQAQNSLGLCLESVRGREAADEAVLWYRKAAEQGHAEAQHNLGVCLKNGEGVAQDVAQAAVWYRKAAEQGLSDAQHNLGLLLLQGAEGVPQDAKAGARLLAPAAQQGVPHALAALARYAGDREVAKACCLGCGATTNLQACSRCHVARFCGKACVVRTWPVHKAHCKCWQAEAKAAAESSA